MTYLESLRLKAERLDAEAEAAWEAYYAALNEADRYRRAATK